MQLYACLCLLFDSKNRMICSIRLHFAALLLKLVFFRSVFKRTRMCPEKHYKHVTHSNVISMRQFSTWTEENSNLHSIAILYVVSMVWKLRHRFDYIFEFSVIAQCSLLLCFALFSFLRLNRFNWCILFLQFLFCCCCGCCRWSKKKKKQKLIQQ